MLEPPSLGLVTDLYQLTMAAGYWRSGLADRDSVFHLFFRRAPFAGSYAVACGLQPVVEFLCRWRFSEDDLDYLRAQQGHGGRPLFEAEFLRALADVRFTGDVDAVAEGTVVFPHEPLLRVRGSLLQAQVVETALLTLINFQTLIATKASRVCRAAQGDAVLDFGLRRAQGLDGGHSASRACYVGGCAGTSNVWAGQRYGIPVRGTHAHSWVLSFDDELEAFRAYAAVMPHNCTLLVDTYDTAVGIDRAIQVGLELRRDGHRLAGVRLDSGDLVELSRLARRKLDAAGLPDAKVVASNDLDEHRIVALKEAGAAIDLWGVGTRLVTGGGEGALGGVYKLSAIADDEGRLQDRVKLSEDAIKSSLPGVQQVRRHWLDGRMVGDVIYDQEQGTEGASTACDRRGQTVVVPAGSTAHDLLVPVLRGGKPVDGMPSLDASRRHAAEQVAALPEKVVQWHQPESFPVGISQDLYRRWRRAQRHPSHSS